ncbi:unnamed protein product [Clonostachys rosea f. rosea IK726]|uniref:Uncharacterized protein n=1 Tax=Clonostachys rosea f. rosea IK726 TaxID=1349383 RepID=A0ACA9UG89_BIOOC|nr:unnamed protein product [Clonostachys rosea f. rosea IK726]
MSRPQQKSIAVVHTHVWNMDGLMTAPGPSVKRQSSRRKRCADCRAGESVLSGSCVLHTSIHIANRQRRSEVNWSDLHILGQEDFQTSPSISSEGSSPSEASLACEEMKLTTRFLFSNIRTTESELESILQTFSGSLDKAERPGTIRIESRLFRYRAKDEEPKEEYTEEAYRGVWTWILGSYEQMFCFARGDCSGSQIYD